MSSLHVLMFQYNITGIRELFWHNRNHRAQENMLADIIGQYNKMIFNGIKYRNLTVLYIELQSRLLQPTKYHMHSHTLWAVQHLHFHLQEWGTKQMKQSFHKFVMSVIKQEEILSPSFNLSPTQKIWLYNLHLSCPYLNTSHQ